MPSQKPLWYQDVRLIEALEAMRRRKEPFMAKCFFCGLKSAGIKEIDQKLYSVCDDHKTGLKNINDLLSEQTSFEE